MSSSQTLKLIRSKKLNINNYNSLKHLTTIAYTLFRHTYIMEYRNRIYNLLINEQSSILELLKVMDVKNPKEKIKNILDEQFFEIIECSENEIIKIKKKTTGEIFEKGCKFYYKKYDKWIENMYFDASLFGVYYGETFYKNYVRGNSGLYHLDQISLTDKKDETSTIQKEIVLNGITYVVKE